MLVRPPLCVPVSSPPRPPSRRAGRQSRRPPTYPRSLTSLPRADPSSSWRHSPPFPTGTASSRVGPTSTVSGVFTPRRPRRVFLPGRPRGRSGSVSPFLSPTAFLAPSPSQPLCTTVAPTTVSAPAKMSSPFPSIASRTWASTSATSTRLPKSGTPSGNGRGWLMWSVSCHTRAGPGLSTPAQPPSHAPPPLPPSPHAPGSHNAGDAGDGRLRGARGGPVGDPGGGRGAPAEEPRLQAGAEPA